MKCGSRSRPIHTLKFFVLGPMVKNLSLSTLSMNDGRIPQPVQFLKDVINSSVFNNIFEISDVTEA